MTNDVSVGSLIEALPDALLVVDTAGTIFLANTQAEWLFGRPRTTMIGYSIDMLLPERFRDRHAKLRHNYSTNPRLRPMGYNLPLIALNQNGEEIQVQISLSPLMTPSGMFVVAVIRRATELFKD